MTNATTHEHDLEDHIPTLRKLDEARRQSAELRNAGIEVLMEICGTEEEKTLLARKDDWRHESSLVIRALLPRHDQPLSKQKERLDLIKCLISRLQDDGSTSEKHAKDKKDKKDDELSVLAAASVLRALTAQPGAGFSRMAMRCHYWIIRELYTADRSDWSIGGARAAPGGLVTAFTTGECARALLSFADALRNTGQFVAGIGEYLTRVEQLNKLDTDYFTNDLPLAEWVKAEKKRLILSYSLKLQRLSRYRVLSLVISEEIDPDTDMENYLNKITAASFKKQLRQEIKEATTEFQLALKDIKQYRDKENNDAINMDQYLYKEPFTALSTLSRPRKQQLNNVTRSDSAHMIAVLAVKYALDQVEKAGELFANGKEIDHLCRKIELGFDEAVGEVRKLLHPVKSYLSSVLDRELALVSLGESLDWQPGELACAAASYGRLTEKWEKDVRFGRAVSDLSKMVSSRGRFANPRHIHEWPNGDRRMMGNAVTLHAMAQLLDHARDSEIETGLAKNMLRFFEDTRANQAYVSETEESVPLDKKGWGWEFSQPPLKTDLMATASAVMALAEINKMLDTRINHIILEHFSVKQKQKGEGLDANLTLDSLFYPDYGLRLAPDANAFKAGLQRPEEIEEKDWPENGIERKESVAITLQQMRAHVSRVSLPKEYNSLCSLVLHGPAGTGKTTLVEALAVTCDVPLVEVTPSDLVRRGEENIEQRARAVFEALSMLTRVVILFDEFDPVLKRRDAANNNPLSVFSFLTPGMLPKLKDLHNGAEKRSVAYVLVTNLIGGLDEAAVRQGRFDERLGIYPPDLLSRAGRLLDQIHEDFIAKKSRKFKSKSVPWNRIVKIIKKTEGKGMTTLGKPGWFTIPDKKHEDLKKKLGTPYHFLHLKKISSVESIKELEKRASLEWPEPDDKLKDIRGKGRTAVKECLQSMWVEAWDNTLEEEFSSKTIAKDYRDELVSVLLKEKVCLIKLPSPKLPQSSRDEWEVMVGRDKSFTRRMLIRCSEHDTHDTDET